MFYKCPNCGRVYGYGEEGWYQCLNCKYPLKKVEDVKNVKHPELNKHNIIGTIKDQNKNIPKCPTCQSTNVQAISGMERGLSIIGFGIFSKKINKSFKCEDCGYTW